MPPTGFYCKRLTNANSILPIQTEGCTYFCFIVLNGEQRAKIWALDTNEFDSLPALTAVESNFLNWYESWLNNSLSSLAITDKRTVEKNNAEKKPAPWWKRVFSKSKSS